MSSYKVGDKFIIEIDKIFNQDGETLYRAKGMKSLVFDEYGLNILKPLEDETMKLLRENAELKERMQKDIDKICDLCSRNDALDVARAAGAEKAWKLAQKIALFEADGGYSDDELNEIFDSPYLSDIFSITYSEAAAKVEAWEQKKEENCLICQYYERTADQYPCSHCRNCYPSKFKAKLGGRENENQGG